MAGKVAEVIGFLGAGQLGEPMVHRLLGAGHDVVAYARRNEVRDRLSQAGAAVVDSVAEVAQRSDVLIGCLFSDDQLREIAGGSDGFVANAKPGSVFVSHTTGTASTLATISSAAGPALTVLDAPVSGTADHIKRGNLTVLIGGPSEAVAFAQPVLTAYADPILHTGALGSALKIKLINNVLFAANSQLLAAAIALGADLGVEPDALLAALAASSGGSAASSYVQTLGGIDAFAKGATPFLRKDVAAALVTAEQMDADLGLLRQAIENGALALGPDAAM
jgi:3-hydroxyisobutyrate dehydrogenase-like beta-hydroxyacid dehydrogenase